MKRMAFGGLLFAAIFVVAPGTYAQAQAAAPGFSVSTVIFELSYFMPSPQPPAGQATQRQGRLNAFLSARDPKLFLTASEVDALLPIVEGLKNNAFPSPSAAKKLQADIDAVLTGAQKDAWSKAQAEMAKARSQAQARNQSTTGRQNLLNMTPDQRQQYLDSLPPDQRQQLQNRLDQASQLRQLSPEERRQREIDNLVSRLQDYRTQIK